MHCIKTTIPDGWRRIECGRLSIAEAIEVTLDFMLQQKTSIVTLGAVRDYTCVHLRAESRGGLPVPELRFRIDRKDYPFLLFLKDLFGELHPARQEHGMPIHTDDVPWSRVESALLAAAASDVCDPGEIERLLATFEALFKLKSIRPSSTSGEHLITRDLLAIAV